MGSKLTATVVVALLVAPWLVGGAAASGTGRTMGIAAGDRAVFSYEIYTSSPSTVLGENFTTDVFYNTTITFTSVNVNASLGYFGYEERVDLLNQKTINETVTNETTFSTSTLKNNVSTIFDPYDNNTYLGNLGFFPVAYTNLLNGSTHLQVTATVNETTGSPQNITASVIRTKASIGINFTVNPWVGALPWTSYSVFDPRTGLMERTDVYTHFFGVSKYFHYRLLNFTPASNNHVYLYAEIFAFGAIIAVAAVAIARRKPETARKAAKMREKFS